MIGVITSVRRRAPSVKQTIKNETMAVVLFILDSSFLHSPPRGSTLPLGSGGFSKLPRHRDPSGFVLIVRNRRSPLPFRDEALIGIQRLYWSSFLAAEERSRPAFEPGLHRNKRTLLQSGMQATTSLTISRLRANELRLCLRRCYASAPMTEKCY